MEKENQQKHPRRASEFLLERVVSFEWIILESIH